MEEVGEDQELDSAPKAKNPTCLVLRASPVPPLLLAPNSKITYPDLTPRSDGGLVTARDVGLSLDSGGEDAGALRVQSPSELGIGSSAGSMRQRVTDGELNPNRLKSPSPIQLHRKKLLAEASITDSPGATQSAPTRRHSFIRRGTGTVSMP